MAEHAHIPVRVTGLMFSFLRQRLLGSSLIASIAQHLDNDYGTSGGDLTAGCRFRPCAAALLTIISNAVMHSIMSFIDSLQRNEATVARNDGGSGRRRQAAGMCSSSLSSVIG